MLTNGSTRMAFLPGAADMRLCISTSATSVLPPLVGAEYTRLRPSSTPGMARHSRCQSYSRSTPQPWYASHTALGTP